MKLILILLAHILINLTAFTQTSTANIRPGTWKDADTWVYNRVPTDTDNVVLIQDIVVDTKAFCRSLTTNGYNITVASGQHLTIAGNDSMTGVIDEDTLIKKLTVTYYGSSGSGEVVDIDYFGYEYDSMKRISQIINYTGDYAYDTTTFYYLQNSPYPYETIYSNPCDYQLNNNCVPQKDTNYYKYNADGIVIQDSARSRFGDNQFNGKSTSNYKILGDSVVRYRLANSFIIDYTNGTQVVYESFRNDTSYYNRSMNNGNIVHQVTHSNDRNSEHIFSYDHAKNPFYPSTIHLPVLPLEMLLFEGPEQFNNNLTHEENYDFGGSVNHIKFKSAFRYKLNGFPVEMILVDELDNTLIIFKYQYTK